MRHTDSKTCISVLRILSLKMFDLLLALHRLQSLHFFSTAILNRPVDQSLRFLKRHLNQDENVSFPVLIIKINWLHSTLTY